MAKQMPIWAVGPKIMVPTFGYLVVVGIATYLWPALSLFPTVPYAFFLVSGIVLLAPLPMRRRIIGRLARLIYCGFGTRRVKNGRNEICPTSS